MTRRPTESNDRLQRAEELMNEGDLDEALRVVRSLEGREKLEDEDRLEGMLLESQILSKKGDFKDALRLTTALLQELGSDQRQKRIVCLNEQSKCLWRTGDLVNARVKAQESLELAEQSPPDLHGQGDALNTLGNIYGQRGELGRAEEYYQRSLALQELLGNPKAIAASLNNLGLIYWQRGELNQAEEYYQRSLVLIEQIGNPQYIASSLNNLGIIYLHRGELNQAEEYHQRSLAIWESLGNPPDIAKTLSNLGVNCSQRGELNQAEEYYQRSLVIWESLGNPPYIAGTLSDLGLVYWLRGELNQAEEYYQRSLDLNEQIGNNLGMTRGLFGLVFVAIDQHSLDRAWGYLERLKQIDNQEENKVISQRYRVAEALVLKASPRMEDKARAEELFQHVVEEEIVDHPLTVVAMLHLSELLVDELGVYGEAAVFQEAKTLVRKLYVLAQEQPSFTLVVNTLILRAKLAMVDGDLTVAAHFLDQAKMTAEEKGLGRLAEKASTESQQLIDQYDTWQHLIQSNAPFHARLEQAQLGEYFKDALRLQISS